MDQADSAAARRDLAFHLHPSTNLALVQAEGPLVISRGEGVYVYDEAGNRYIEGMAGLWCAGLGFSEKRLAEAAYRQMLALPFYHSFSGKVPAISTELAEKLVGVAPEGMGRVFFANSGSEANDSAVKLAWYYNNALGRPDKKKLISRRKAYHGVTVASASLTGLAFAHSDWDLPAPRFLHAETPHHWRGARPGESEEAYAQRLADELERLILAEGPDTVAAFFAEPVMGAGGVLVPPATYFERVQQVLGKYDVLMIADEVICGFGRTGNMFGSQTFGIRPDVITCAKMMTSGYQPMSAMMVSQRIYSVLEDQSRKLGVFGHGFTYSGHPVPAAVALETLAIYEERDLLAHVRRVAPVLQEGLRAMADHPMVGEARGVGLIGAWELVRDKATKAGFDPKAAVGAQFVRNAQRRGAILRVLPGDIIAFSPPLVIEEHELRELLAHAAGALDETWQWVKAKGLA
ncbi:aspartate aminotransferase family protein [Zeimonas arvi]|uniref:Aspartate aminotransferase family protein n=1 Tax=Zeimonas arvi TaxID=2498847 RepID=A0A5C8NUM3_9BURK|nr:aspartate aminotransferase family protein [Zeimonas arvi]TXL64790.1 aspartate aminotransferase family protein [Zeimonas arvi]